jgi:hypothetical protein
MIKFFLKIQFYKLFKIKQVWTKSKRKTNSMVILEICRVSVKIKGERIKGKK